MYATGSGPRFRVKGWIEDEDFRRLLEIARYLGRSEGYSLFELDLERARRRGYTDGDIIAILSSIAGLVEEDIEEIRRFLEERKKVRIYMGEDGWLRVKSRVLLKPILAELGVSLPYDREERAYKAPPHMYRDLVQLFQKKGLAVEDKIGLLEGGKLPREITFTGKLRPYQEEALRAWEENGHRGIIALPTGAGKTVIAIAGIARLGRMALVVVYTKEQVKQWVEAVLRFTDAPRSMVGAYYGDEKRIAPITVTTYQTAFRKLRVFSSVFPLIIFDEAHHLPADKFRAIATYMPSPYRLGLSATPEREDGKHEILFPLMGGVVYRIAPGELTRQGYLVPYQIRRVKVSLEPEERRKYEELRRRYFQLARGRTIREIVEAARRGDPEAVEALRINNEMRRIVQYSRAKIESAARIIREELARGSKIIVFTQYRRQAEEIAREVGGLLLHGGIDKRRRERILDQFRRARSGVLVLTTVGDEGLDIPDANVGVFVSGTSSPRQFVQRLGRLLRPSPGKDKAVLYEIIVEGTSEEVQSRRRKKVV